AHPPADPMDHSVAGAARRGPGILEESDVRPGAALLVGVEEVVHGRVVLVDRLLDQPKSQHARVEVDVLAGVARDGRDVVDALKLHGFTAYSQRAWRSSRRYWPTPAAPTLPGSCPRGSV